MLSQWLGLAYGLREDLRKMLEKDGRFFDPLRPAIEPDRFESEEELWTARQVTYAALRKVIETAHVFVYTLGLSERWHNAETGLECAIHLGTSAGTFDPDKRKLTNAEFRTTYRALMRTRRFACSKKLNWKCC